MSVLVWDHFESRMGQLTHFFAKDSTGVGQHRRFDNHAGDGRVSGACEVTVNKKTKDLDGVIEYR